MEEPYIQVEQERENKVFKKSRFIEKIVFVLAVITIIFLTHAVVYGQWLLPFYYAVCTPILIFIRIVIKNKWQFFLIDFCYFGNILWFVYIWCCDVKIYFDIVFALANGPLLWAMVVYRNSLVFHSVDKVTSSYIHILPGLLSFGIRWYPEETSKYWFKDFVKSFTFNEMSILWLMVLPLFCFMFHSLMYYCIIHIIVKPSEEYVTSFSYLGQKEDSCLFKIFNCFGSRWRTFSFYFFNTLFCLATLLGVLLVYNFYIAHCVLLAVMSLVIIYNGGSYYMDVFSTRGFISLAKRNVWVIMK
ncbi:hypothetical protein KUTeg_004902 [Tegillarca granosa]|uniref:Glycerophosphocholine acyltransferase 1 n=1 Tax=Tegillarca granosa TaxID=220873 RepID=A0ABQ9FI88_TEGGR|nr:hypothetical protein KUTeg_004902 [Tegillarca granosa]